MLVKADKALPNVVSYENQSQGFQKGNPVMIRGVVSNALARGVLVSHDYMVLWPVRGPIYASEYLGITTVTRRPRTD